MAREFTMGGWEGGNEFAMTISGKMEYEIRGSNPAKKYRNGGLGQIPRR
jgi:hypothetical protein